MTFDLSFAEKLLHMDARIPGSTIAAKQLDGAVAAANILERRKVVYLADEVGMGKTYVALGAMAILRHVYPDFRVLIIAPRGNIQTKWKRELELFYRHNVRVKDLRNKGLDGGSAKPIALCDSVFEFVRQASANPHQDYILRLSSFSLAASIGDTKDIVTEESAAKLIDRVKSTIPWLDKRSLANRNKQQLKSKIAEKLNELVPEFDLVIIDEGHNLKHGLAIDAAARNHVLHNVLKNKINRAMFLSATPVEHSYKHLFNQLSVVQKEEQFMFLEDDTLSDEDKKRKLQDIVIRRVYHVSLNCKDYTRNMYRREWRNGGVHLHDEPIRTANVREQLAMALVQNKVSEILERDFNNSFQIGMLASFESFAETLANSTESTFDDADQTKEDRERQGADVSVVNAIVSKHRERFKTELPHPKMNALVDSMSDSFNTGEKSLIFVRRVASVREIKNRLDIEYNSYLWKRLNSELALPTDSMAMLRRAYDTYSQDRFDRLSTGTSGVVSNGSDNSDVDSGDIDTFFAWYFRGDGPDGVFSGGHLNKRFTSTSGLYSTMFELNYLALVLDCSAADVMKNLSKQLSMPQATLQNQLQDLARSYIGSERKTKKLTRKLQFEATQAAGLELLANAKGPLGAKAALMRRVRLSDYIPTGTHARSKIDVERWACLPTFFSELRAYSDLQSAFFPTAEFGPDVTSDPLADESSLKNHLKHVSMLSGVSRLGHSYIDLYIAILNNRGRIALGPADVSEVDVVEDVEDATEADQDRSPIVAWLDKLEQQRTADRSVSGYCAFDELSTVARDMQMIIEHNAHELEDISMIDLDRQVARLLRRQQPVFGMFGAINQTVIKQFRMPGYPLILISTDLLQEGEDLHLYCSRVYHYGIAWTPSAMEQRTGRIDRVKSQTDRRLGRLNFDVPDDQKLQVYYPYLKDTYETLQARRVFERMNRFLQLVNSNVVEFKYDSRINVESALLESIVIPQPLTERLESAFPINESRDLKGKLTGLKVDTSHAEILYDRLRNIHDKLRLVDDDLKWEPIVNVHEYSAVLTLKDGRKEDIRLSLTSRHDRVYLTCRSIIGDFSRIEIEQNWEHIAANANVKLLVKQKGTKRNLLQLRAMGEVELVSPTSDKDRAIWLIRQVANAADAIERLLADTDEDHDSEINCD
jgi:hypothetical protein